MFGKTSNKTTKSTTTAKTSPPKTDTLDAAKIEAWVLGNKDRAKALGMRMFAHQANPAAMKTLPSLGEFEDRVVEWAIANPDEARSLFMKLAMKIMA